MLKSYSSRSTGEDESMSNSLNIQLTTELRRYVDERASDNGVYATPGEIVQGLREIRQGKSVKKTAMDVFNEQ